MGADEACSASDADFGAVAGGKGEGSFFVVHCANGDGGLLLVSSSMCVLFVVKVYDAMEISFWG